MQKRGGEKNYNAAGILIYFLLTLSSADLQRTAGREGEPKHRGWGGGEGGGGGGCVSQCTTVLNVVARGLQGPGSIISGLEGKSIDRVTIYSSPRADKWQTDQR